MSGQHGAKGQVGREAHLNPDGSVTCVCGVVITFLPPAEQKPEAGPNSVNHPGCGSALHGEETVNLIDRKEVDAFYAHQKASS
jgi:hypothetical protein